MYFALHDHDTLNHYTVLWGKSRLVFNLVNNTLNKKNSPATNNKSQIYIVKHMDNL